jgi:hypothetical protein
MKRLTIAALLCLAMVGCSPVKHIETDAVRKLQAQVQTLKDENAHLKTLSGKVQTIVENHTVTEVVKDTTSMLNWYKFIGIMAMGLGAAAIAGAAALASNLILKAVSPILRVAGYMLLALGGTFFVVSLTTQLALGWLPYFLFAAMAMTFVGATVYIIRHVNWSKEEKAAVQAVVNGEPDAAQHPIIQAIVKN